MRISGDHATMIIRRVTALYLDFSACSFQDNSLYSFDPIKVTLCK